MPSSSSRPALSGLVGATALLAVTLAAGFQDAEPAGDESFAAAPRLYRIIVPVSDLDQAAAFYGELLGAEGQRISGGRHYIDCGGVILALYMPGGDGDTQQVRPLPEHVYFAVPDLEAVFERASRLGGLDEPTGDGALPMGKIATRPWRERSFYMHDPFGTPLCFVDAQTLFTGF